MGVLAPELGTQGYGLVCRAVTPADASFSCARNKKVKRLAGTALPPPAASAIGAQTPLPLVLNLLFFYVAASLSISAFAKSRE